MRDYSHYCIACMEDNQGQDVCPVCGSRQDTAQIPPLLPTRTILAQRYVVGLELHSNTESISYIGNDTISDSIVMIKEFLPDGIAVREELDATVSVAPGHERTFRRLYASFLEYNRAIGRMREVSAIIPIYDIFEENGTAYTVSELPETISLREFVENNGGQISWSIARPLFMPILSALGAMSASGVNHLGITPDTLVIMTNGKMKMTGFGIPAVRRVGLGLKPELTDGCAALEQYSNNEPVGEATDIYGFCACLFFALTGKLPQDANRRANDGRLLIPTSVLRQLPQHVVTAMANGLLVFQLKRTQTFERLRDELLAAPSVRMNFNPDAAERAAQGRPRSQYNAPPMRPDRPPQQRKKRLPSTVYGIISGIVALIVLAIVGIAYFSNMDEIAGMESGSSTISGMSSTAPSGPSSGANSGASSSISSIPAPTGEMIQVPDLTGKTLKDVQNDPDFEDFKILLSRRDFSTEVKEDEIMEQYPPLNTQVYPGEVISVVVCKGTPTRKLPKIAGKKLDDARIAIAAAGFECGTVTSEPNSTVPPGCVIRYRSLQEGAEAEAESFVDVVISAENSSSSSSNQ